MHNTGGKKPVPLEDLIKSCQLAETGHEASEMAKLLQEDQNKKWAKPLTQYWWSVVTHP